MANEYFVFLRTAIDPNTLVSDAQELLDKWYQGKVVLEQVPPMPEPTWLARVKGTKGLDAKDVPFFRGVLEEDVRFPMELSHEKCIVFRSGINHPWAHWAQRRLMEALALKYGAKIEELQDPRTRKPLPENQSRWGSSYAEYVRRFHVEDPEDSPEEKERGKKELEKELGWDLLPLVEI